MGQRGFAVCLCVAMTVAGSGCQFLGRRDIASAVTPPQPSSHGSRMLQLAERYEEQGNLEGALRLYRQAAKANPGDPQIRTRIAEITGEPSEATPDTQLAQRDTLESHRPAAAPHNEPTPEPVAERPTRLTAAQAREIFSTEDSGSSPQPSAMPEQMMTAARTDSHPAPFPEMAADIRQPSLAVNVDVDVPVWWNSDADRPSTPAALATNAAWSRTPSQHRDDSASLQGLMAELASADAFDRKSALVRLARHQTDAAGAASSVRELFNDDDPLVQAHAAWTYGEITKDRSPSVAVLVGLLNTNQSDVQQVSAYFLGTYGGEAFGAVPALETVRDTTSGATRIHAAEALLRINHGSTASIDALLLELRLGDPSARALAAIALSGAAPQYQAVVIRALTDALQDREPQVSSAAALSLGGFGVAAQSAIPSLEVAKAHPDQDVREAADAALDCIR